MAPRQTTRARNLAAVTGRPLRCALYLRISSDRDGDEAGVTRQREDCQARAAREGWTIIREYCDNDTGASSASRKARPQYAEMIAAAERGEFDVVLAYSNSRLTRRHAAFEEAVSATLRASDLRGVDLSAALGAPAAVTAWDLRRRVLSAAADRAADDLADVVRDLVRQPHFVILAG